MEDFISEEDIESGHRQRISYAQDVQDLIDNHVFTGTFEKIEQRCKEALFNSRQEKEILKLHLKAQIIEEFKEELIDSINDGIYSSEELQKIKTK